MIFLFIGISVLLCSGLLALLTCRFPRCSTIAGSSGAVVGSIIGLVGIVPVFLGKEYPPVHYAWNMPFGSFTIILDSLSALFLVLIFGLSALAAIYGSAYLYEYRNRKWLGVPWFSFNLLIASMAIVVVAGNGVLFLVAWEIMSLASFFLVTFENRGKSVIKAGYIYFIATHISTAFLLAFFLLLGRETGSMDFINNAAELKLSVSTANLLFLLALTGFGIKAGFIPFHIWLPEAHPAAPSHVSAVMSGVMIKTGIYGLIRFLIMLGPPPAWWAWTLIGIGLTSGILGVLYALAQHDLKRLLAYHSVENIGIITLGLGTGLLGLSHNSPVLTIFGFAGCLLHVANHAIFKGLLFLGAGAVLHGTGTRDIDRLGGLIKKMPVTAAAFLTGSLAISGLPPLNGFISEFLIYFGAFKGAIHMNVATAVPALAVILGLTLIGGLAAACFAKAFGIVFLGEPRSELKKEVHETGLLMQIPMVFLSLSCLFIGLYATTAVKAMSPVVSAASGMNSAIVARYLLEAARPLSSIVFLSAVLLGLAAALFMFRRILLSQKKIKKGVTWGCGYAAASPRLQYTAASFARPFINFFSFCPEGEKSFNLQPGIFPEKTTFKSHCSDFFAAGIYRPLFQSINRALSTLHWLQAGRVHFYVLYVALTLVCLLVWYIGLSL